MAAPASQGSAQGPGQGQGPVLTHLQLDPSATKDVFVPVQLYPSGTLPGDLIAIRPVIPPTSKGKAKDKPLLFKVESLADEPADPAARRRAGKPVVVVHPSLAVGFDWCKNRVDVNLTLVIAPPPPCFVATHVELYFSNVYLGRPDQFRLSLALIGSVVSVSQRVLLPGSQARLRVGAINSLEDKRVQSALVDADTKFIFRSESARCFIFVEVSQEIWQFEEDGSMLREKCEVFLSELFGRFAGPGPGGGGAASHTVVLDLTPSPPRTIARQVSVELNKWASTVLLRTLDDGTEKYSGRIAFAHESPILSAVNLALNSFEEHWIDRDLQRTGLALLIITAGTSYYKVEKSLLRITTERMLFHGLGLDIISLSKAPLHTVPLFSFQSHEPGLSEDRSATTKPSTTVSSLLTDNSYTVPEDQKDPLYYDSPSPTQEKSTYFAEPLWVFCSFFGYQVDKPHRIDRFMPRARCYELVSQGVAVKIPIAIPLLNVDEGKDEEWSFMSEQEKKVAARDRYDTLAVGGKVGEMGGWERRSGATSGTSEGSAGYARAPATFGMMSRKKEIPERDRERDRINREKERERATQARAVSAALPSTGERERGRRRASESSPRIASSTRSRTPVGRPAARPRSPSVTPSLNTLSSKATSSTKTSTPALISRLTAAPTTSSSNTTTNTSKSGGWLGLFRSGQTTSITPAPSVAIQPVQAFSGIKPEFDLESDTSIIADRRRSSAATITSASASGSPTSRRSSSTVLSHPQSFTPSLALAHSKPTQPISISTKSAQTREADRPSKVNAGSSSLKKFTPVLGPARSSGGRSAAQRFNPSKPGKRSLGLADQARRWSNIFVRHANDQRAVNWISTTRGACLPITTDYLPTSEALTNQYSDYRYSIPTNSATTSFLLRTDNARRSPALELVTELISQRLSQGFQICTPANAIGALDEINQASSKTIPDVLKDIHEGELSAVYLSLANQIHRISYDRRSQCVVVKILQRRSSWKTESVDYAALVWTQGAKNYAYTNLTFPYPSLTTAPEWQHWDRLVAGVERPDLRPSLRFWRTRLVLLPGLTVPDREYLVENTPGLGGGQATDAEIHSQGFLNLMSTLQGLRWTSAGVDREPTDVVRTRLTAPEWAADMGFKISQQPDNNAPNTPSHQRTLWLQRMISTPNPREANGSSPFPGINRTSSTPDGAIKSVSPPLPKRPTVHMAYSIVLDLDPQQRSERSERVHCHFDRSHNPEAAYHLELTWLAGSGKIIDNAIQSWTRAMSKWGLTLAEVSSRPVESTHNPFQRASQVALAVKPPKVDPESGVHRHYYEAGLLKSLDFFLDIGADDTFPPNVDVQYSYRRASSSTSQYISRSGTLLVSVLGGDEGFAYVPNRIFCAHSQKSPEEEVKLLLETCRDEEKLKGIWDLLEASLPAK
ncbi:vacuolar membrane protein [Pseudohyphozyma bogoriensis]|nr:vacuolar membrane protein [Pseudohyphozyma bogoriensis]